VSETINDYLGSETNPFSLEDFKVSEKAFLTVCKLLSINHLQVTKLSKEEVKACDKVVEQLCLDKYRHRYFFRSREGDETHGSYKIKILQPTKISLDEENVSRKSDFKETIVIVKERFIGKTSKAFEYKLPDDVIAVKNFKIEYDYYGGSIQLNHLSDVHQSSIEISNEHSNDWCRDSYTEEFS
jgi:hypothetical protein